MFERNILFQGAYYSSFFFDGFSTFSPGPSIPELKETGFRLFCIESLNENETLLASNQDSFTFNHETLEFSEVTAPLPTKSNGSYEIESVCSRTLEKTDILSTLCRSEVTPAISSCSASRIGHGIRDQHWISLLII